MSNKDKCPRIIEHAARVMCYVLYQKYPELKDIKLDSFGFPSGETSFEDRMIFCIYLELLKSGVMDNEVTVKDSNNGRSPTNKD